MNPLFFGDWKHKTNTMVIYIKLFFQDEDKLFKVYKKWPLWLDW